MTPGPAHKAMAEETGTWSNDLNFWPAPGAPAAKMNVTCETKMIMGGLYQDMYYTGTMEGMPFEGRSTLSYNNATGEYTNTWIDNMGTGMMVVKGKAAPGAKSYTLVGEVADPLTGKMIKIRQVYTIVDANTRKLEMFDTKNGEKEYKSMEIIMKRK